MIGNSGWRRGLLLGLGGVLAVMMANATATYAQDEPSEASETVRREAREQVARAKATQSLAAGAEMPGEGVAYSDVLSDPDQPEINLLYVKSLIARGNIQLAAATTERLLLIYPEADDVRLLYAILLYRMDVLDEASVQLDILEQHQPTGAIKAEAARYRELIKQRLSPLKRSASLSIGMHYDTNRNSFPDNDLFLIRDTRFRIPGGEENDWGRIAIGSAQISRDIEQQNLQQVFADLAVLRDDQVEIDELDVSAFLLNAGILYRTIYGDLIPRVHASWIELNEQKYSQDYSVSLLGQRPVFKGRIKAFAEVTTGWRRYNNTRLLPFSSEQDGDYQRYEIGGARQFDALTSLRVTAAVNNIDADLPYEGYDGFDINATLSRLLPRGAFLLASVNFERQYYDGNDPFISARKRQDRDWNLDLTYGVPVGTVIGVFGGNPAGPEPLREIVLNLTAGFEDSHSNLPNYQYDNYRLQFLFSRNWNF